MSSLPTSRINLNNEREIKNHIVAKIVKAELIVGSVGDVGLISLAPRHLAKESSLTKLHLLRSPRLRRGFGGQISHLLRTGSYLRPPTLGIVKISFLVVQATNRQT